VLLYLVRSALIELSRTGIYFSSSKSVARSSSSLTFGFGVSSSSFSTGFCVCVLVETAGAAAAALLVVLERVNFRNHHQIVVLAYLYLSYFYLLLSFGSFFEFTGSLSGSGSALRNSPNGVNLIFLLFFVCFTSRVNGMNLTMPVLCRTVNFPKELSFKVKSFVWRLLKRVDSRAATTSL